VAAARRSGVVASWQRPGGVEAWWQPACVLAVWIGRGVSGSLEWVLRLGAVRTLRGGDRVRVRRWRPGPISSEEGDGAGKDDGDDDGDDDGAGATSARTARTAGEGAKARGKRSSPR